MKTDRAQDAEAILAARRIKDAIWEATEPTGFHGLPNAQADEVIAWFAKREARLVARLGTAEQRLEQQIDEAVARWHDAPCEVPPLHEWLGLTWMEYALYVQSGVAELAAVAPGETEQARLAQLQKEGFEWPK